MKSLQLSPQRVVSPSCTSGWRPSSITSSSGDTCCASPALENPSPSCPRLEDVLASEEHPSRQRVCIPHSPSSSLTVDEEIFHEAVHPCCCYACALVCGAGMDVHICEAYMDTCFSARLYASCLITPPPCVAHTRCAVAGGVFFLFPCHCKCVCVRFSSSFVVHCPVDARCAAATNAGFFDIYRGHCLGNLVSNGEVLQADSSTRNANFGVTKDGKFVYGYLTRKQIEDMQFANLMTVGRRDIALLTVYVPCG